uniref:Uncharacterized protein n=1 Tax=Ditylenchus dipsaci TaxID=166011 RepID=A0A915DI04_9BILA
MGARSKYVTKGSARYITKGAPLMYVGTQRGRLRPGQPEVVDYDRMAHEAKTSHTSYGLPTHEPNREPLFYLAGQVNAVAANYLQGNRRVSELLAAFILWNTKPASRQFTFEELPFYYWFDKKTKSSTEKRSAVALRLLLLHVKGPLSFEHLSTVSTRQDDAPDFVQAARALGLLEDEDIWRQTMDEAAHFSNCRQMRKLFVQILVHSSPPVHTARQLIISLYEKGESTSMCLIEYMLRQHDMSCRQWSLPEPVGFLMPTVREQVQDYFFPGQQHLNDELPDEAGPTPPPDFFPI